MKLSHSVARKTFSAVSHSKGMSLIELLVSITIGLLVVGSAIAIFLSNKQTYVAAENVGRVQENMRIAYELMARDVREAVGTPCQKHTATLRNVVTGFDTRWWTNSSPGLRIVGYTGAQDFPVATFGTSPGQRIAGTEAIQLLSTSNSRVEVSSANGASSQFVVNTNNHGFNPGDLVLACNYTRGVLLQVSSAASTSSTIGYGGAAVPGNSVTGYLLPDSDNFASGSVLAKWRPVRWYIGNSNAGSGRSLFQSTVVNNAGTLSVANQEVVQGVQSLAIEYLFNGDYRTADLVTDWTKVSAVRIALVLQGEDQIGTDGNRLQRNITHTIALRNRNK
jgi:type IV pilus assembly protein PilW